MKTIAYFILGLVFTIIILLIFDIVLMSKGWSFFFGYFQFYLNINIWLVRMIAIVFLAVTIFYVLPEVKAILNPLKNSSQKQKPALILVGFLCVIFFLTFVASRKHQLGKCMAWNGNSYENVPCNWEYHQKHGTPVYTITKDNVSIFTMEKIKANRSTIFFGPVEGEPIIYYYETRQEIEFYNSKGIHPLYGEELKPVTKEIVEKFLGGEKLLIMTKIQADKNTIFFDHITGEPLIYYYETKEGIEFYNTKGRHPLYGEELKPVTREVVERFFSTTSSKSNEDVITLPTQEIIDKLKQGEEITVKTGSDTVVIQKQVQGQREVIVVKEQTQQRNVIVVPVQDYKNLKPGETQTILPTVPGTRGVVVKKGR